MAVWPETNPTPVYPLIVTPRYSTLSVRFDGGTEQRRQKSLFPVFDVEVAYNGMTPTEADTLLAFFHARAGMFGQFYIFDLSLLQVTGFTHTGRYVGTRDGSTTTYDIPGRSTSSLVVYQDGSQQTITTDYTVSIGTGEGNADQITFTAAGTSGARVTADFSGYARYRVRFADDTLPLQLFERELYSMSIKLRGLSGN